MAELLAEVIAQHEQWAHHTEPKAEQAEAKAKAAAEAKPKPQPQAPPPPLPPPHPLAAKKSATAATEHAELGEMRGELRGLSASLTARKGAKAKLETKVTPWETKLVELHKIGNEDRITMAEHSLEKAKESVEEKEEGIVALDRSVRRMETIVSAEVDKVKEEEVEEVVEEMVEETVKEEVEAKEMVETGVGGGGGWGFFWGRGMRGPSMTCHGTRPPWLAPTPQTWTTPSSSPRRVRFALRF